MVFNDATTKLGLIQDCEKTVFSNYGDISGNSERLYDFTARLNRAYDKVATVIMASDGRWQFDDTNYTDLPIGSTKLFSGRQDYTMDVEFLDIEKVVALDSSGNKFILKPMDIHDPVARLYLTDQSTEGGIPTYYDKTGATMMLYPIPNYDKDSGLTVHYRRKPSYFTYTDTTKSPGIPFVLHRYLSLEASLDYAISKQLSNKNDIAAQVDAMKNTVSEMYAKRSKDEGKFLQAPIRNSR